MYVYQPVDKLIKTFRAKTTEQVSLENKLLKISKMSNVILVFEPFYRRFSFLKFRANAN